MTPKISPFLWYDTQASEAARLYTSLFKDSRIKSIVKLRNTPSGTVEIVDVALAGQAFTLMSAGPHFKFTPAISFLVGFDSTAEVDAAWTALADGGTPMMELGAYPFSERYGWIQDKYGLSWQLMHMGQHQLKQRIVPTLMFCGDQCGNAEEAIRFYTTVFDRSAVGDILRYVDGEAPDAAGTIKHAAFTLAGQEFAAMDSARVHGFSFNEAISLVVDCQNQEEIDYYWSKLSAHPTAEQCGWLKDRFGVSWQIKPTVLGQMLADQDAAKGARVTQAFLKMKKFVIDDLQKAYVG